MIKLIESTEHDLSRRQFIRNIAISTAALTLVPNFLKAQTIYNFSGQIQDLLGTNLANATVRLISPDDVTYSVTTDSNGNYNTSIDTFVEIKDVPKLQDKLAITATWPNPTKEKAAVYINVPKTTKLSVRVCNILGEDITDNVLINPPTGTVQPGQYIQEIDLDGFDNSHANGVYILYVNDGEKTIATKMSLAKDASVSYNGSSSGPPTDASKWILAKNRTSNNQSPKAISKASSSDKWIQEVEYNGVTTKKYLDNVVEGDNTLDAVKMVPNDSEFIQHLDASYRRGGHVNRINSKKTVYLNTDNIASQTETRIEDYLTTDSGGSHNGQFAELTSGNQSYSVGDINRITNAEMQNLGDIDGKWVFNNDGSNSFYIWNDGNGTITAAYCSLGGADDATVQQEIGSCMVGVDDYDAISSMFNDPPTLTSASDFDKQGFAYCFNRLPGTPGSGTNDDQTQARSLGKQTLDTKMQEKLAALTPDQRDQYDSVIEQAGGRAPTYFGFDK